MARQEGSLHPADRAAVGARWVFLSAAVLVAWLLPPEVQLLPPEVLSAIAAGGMLVNLLAWVALRSAFFPAYFSALLLSLDVVLSLVLFGVGGSWMAFYALLPTLYAVFRFDLMTGALIAVGWGIGAGASVALNAPALDRLEVWLPVVVPTVGLLGAVWLGGLLYEGGEGDGKGRLVRPEEVEALRREVERLRAAKERARAIYEMSSTLSATLNYERVLEAALEISALGFEELRKETYSLATRPAAVVFLHGPDHLYVAAGRNLSYGDEERVISGTTGLVGEALSRAEPVIAGNLADDPELSQFPAFRRCRSSICVPLRAGFESYGVVIFASPEPNAFTEEHVELLTAVCNQAVVALQNAQLYQTLREEKERIIEVEEEARKKLARDLHDGPTQSVSAIAMRLNFARLMLDRDPAKAKEELYKLENLARRTTKEIRTMLFTLRPVVLETQGLKAAIEQLVQKLQETGELPVHLEIEEGIQERLDINVQSVAFFIVEEALNNAKKHAGARNIWVRLYIRDGVFYAEVEDDGKGFDVEAVRASYESRGSLGMLNLQERAELVEGHTEIESQPGKGTKVTLVVPLHRE